MNVSVFTVIFKLLSSLCSLCKLLSGTSTMLLYCEPVFLFMLLFNCCRILKDKCWCLFVWCVVLHMCVVRGVSSLLIPSTIPVPQLLSLLSLFSVTDDYPCVAVAANALRRSLSFIKVRWRWKTKLSEGLLLSVSFSASSSFPFCQRRVQGSSFPIMDGNIPLCTLV